MEGTAFASGIFFIAVELSVVRLRPRRRGEIAGFGLASAVAFLIITMLHVVIGGYPLR